MLVTGFNNLNSQKVCSIFKRTITDEENAVKIWK